jgi:hypothetical protein
MLDADLVTAGNIGLDVLRDGDFATNGSTAVHSEAVRDIVVNFAVRSVMDASFVVVFVMVARLRILVLRKLPELWC